MRNIGGDRNLDKQGDVLFSIERFPARQQAPGPLALSHNDGNPNS